MSSLFSAGQFPKQCEPDNAIQFYGRPASEFVLCRNEKGVATAVYGDPAWDFNPYRLGAIKRCKIRFDSVFDEAEVGQALLIEESKYLLYCLIYFAGGGRMGTLSVGTVAQYWFVIRAAMRFCYAQKQKPMVGSLSLQQLFTVPVYLAAFVRDVSFDKAFLSGILRGLARVGEERLGYAVLNPRDFSLKRKESHQHPVIPTRIYLSLINTAGDFLDQISSGVGRLESFIECFDDENYGVSHSQQKSRRLGGKNNYRPDMTQAIESHCLGSVFSGAFQCAHRRNLQRVLLNIQYLLKNVIHLYTGMRDQEVMRMTYLCLSDKVVRQALVDDQSVVRDRGQVVSVISSSTKFSGYKKEGAWFAPREVVKAIDIAKEICRGLAKLYNVELDERCPLFLNPSILSYSRKKSEVGVSAFVARSIRTTAFHGLLIQAEDLQELAQSDPLRDFYGEPGFAIGKPWPLTSHQFRRSLAFYGSNSGFLSLPTVRAQFKHTTIEMARYYSNNYGNLRTIFGYYDEAKGDFVLPSNHFAFEYQMAMPMSVANQLISDLMFSEEPLFGGTGSYAEKQRERIKLGSINVEDVRADTERRVRNGEISYRSTLLGGCTKVGRCDSFLLGDYASCLSCEGAIIKPAKLNSVIEESMRELGGYVEGSGEHQIVQVEVERLMEFKSRVIDKVKI